MDSLKDRLLKGMDGPPRISQAALARACGVRPPSVTNWLSGRTKRLEGANLLAAARALNVSPDWLSSGNGPMRRELGHASYGWAISIDMEPITTIRRDNLHVLINEAGSQAAFARKIAKDKNQVNQWLGRANSRDMSSTIAREIECICGRPDGWMDHPHDGELSTAFHGNTLDADRLRAAIRFLRTQFDLWDIEFIPEERTVMLAHVYKMLSPSNLILLSQWVALQLEKGEKGTEAVNSIAIQRAHPNR
jgi:DNA-binding transcriptional regulator YdaS (Cro superfamily)